MTKLDGRIMTSTLALWFWGFMFEVYAFYIFAWFSRPTGASPASFGFFFLLIIAVTVLFVTKFIYGTPIKDEPLDLVRFSSDPAVVYLAVMASIYLYWFRGQAPFLYGLMEVATGVLTISFVLFTARGDVLARVLGILGGSYVIVRGLDNMDKGCPRSLRKFWDVAFPKRSPAPKT
jgi:hypothetical protein